MWRSTIKSVTSETAGDSFHQGLDFITRSDLYTFYEESLTSDEFDRQLIEDLFKKPKKRNFDT